jgi:putative DNA primase/helicase
VYRCCQAWRQENGFQAEKTRNFKGQLAGRATIDRRRPSSGGEKTTVLVGYRIRKETWCAYP